MFVEFLDLQRLDRLRMAHGLEVRACRFGTFDDEVFEPTRDRERVRRQAGVRADRSERDGDQVEGAAGHQDACGAVSTSTPSFSSISVSAISGRPISAVGSGLSMRVIRAMPSASLLAEPAQS